MTDFRAKFYELVEQEMTAQAKREADRALGSAMAGICGAVAQATMMGAFVIEDPKQAAKSFGESLRWQAAGVLAGVDPSAAIEFIEETKR